MYKTDRSAKRITQKEGEKKNYNGINFGEIHE